MQGRNIISSVARLFVIVFIIIPIGIGIFMTVYQSETETRSAPSSSSSSPSSIYSAPAPQTPQLEVQSWRCDKEHGYVFVRGEVKNISERKLENVVAVGEFRTKSGELVKSEDALLDYNPIMPGQTSPFSAGGTDNPQIQGCRLAFKHLFGDQVAYIEKKKGK